MKRIFLSMMFVTLISAAVSCSGSGTDSATLNVRLVDAPLLLSNGLTAEEVNVVITRVDVVRMGSGEENAGTIMEGDGIFTVLETAMEVNLLDYVKSSGISALIGSLELEPGTYLQLRLIVDITKSTIKFSGDDTRYFLNIPSGGTSGIKIKGNAQNPLFTIGEGEAGDLVFDFDAADSIIVHPTSKDLYSLRPVIKEVQFKNQIVSGLASEACN